MGASNSIAAKAGFKSLIGNRTSSLSAWDLDALH